MVTMNDFEIALISLINGAEIKRLASGSQKSEQKLFENGSHDKLQAYLNFVVASQHMSSSPAIRGITPRIGSAIRWGTSFMKPTARTLERLLLPELLAENLRMLHPVEVSIQTGGAGDINEFYYCIPVWLDSGDVIDIVGNTLPTGWTSGDLSFDPTIHGPQVAYNFANSPGTAFKDYVDDLIVEFHNFGEYHNVVSVSPHMEAQSGAQLLLMDTGVPVAFAPTEDGMLCFHVEDALNNGLLKNLGANQLRHLRNLLEFRDKAVHSPSIFTRFMSEERIEAEKKRSMSPSNKKKGPPRYAAPLGLGINTNVPGNGRFDVFKQMVLPKILVNINGNTNNISAAIAQFGIRDSSRIDSAATTPQLELMNSIYHHTRTRGATAANQTELMKVLRGKTGRGLGSAVALPTRGSGLMSQVAGGGVFGDIIDSVVGSNPYAAALNNAGGWVMDGVNKALGSTPQQRQSARRSKRKSKRASRKR
jgi:hypothetical protein